MYLIAFAYILLDQPLLDYFGGNVAFLEEKSFKTLSPASVKLEAKRKAGNMPHAALAVTHAPLIEEQKHWKKTCLRTPAFCLTNSFSILVEGIVHFGSDSPGG